MWRNGAAQVKSPIGKTLCFPEGCEHSCLRCIPFVFGICYPATVFRAIPTIIIYSIYLQICAIATRFGPYLKGLELHPLIANLNPSSPVTFITIVVFICAALKHSIPNSIQSSAFPNSIVSVDGCFVCNKFYAHAAAGARVGEEFECAHLTECAAVADAFINSNIVHAVCGHSSLNDRTTFYRPRSKAVSSLNCKRFVHRELYHMEDMQGNMLTLDLT